LGKNHLKLVADKPQRSRRVYAGEPIECPTCRSRDLIETYSPHFKDGRIVKGKATGFACVYCQKRVWP
jgi:DNA-directed RNA polymerase subunit RPC12/RpoP